MFLIDFLQLSVLSVYIVLLYDSSIFVGFELSSDAINILCARVFIIYNTIYPIFRNYKVYENYFSNKVSIVFDAV